MKINPHIDLEKIKAELHRLDPKLSEESEAFKAGMVILAAVECGSTNARTLTYVTKLPRDTVHRFVRNLKANGVFHKNEVHDSGWFDEHSGRIAFLLDVCVAEGFVCRAHD